MTGGAIERALLLAAEAGRWEIVEMLARELERRSPGAGEKEQGDKRSRRTGR